MEFDLYFVALVKHDAPQHLVAGPFVDWNDAMDAARAEEQKSVRSYQHIVLKTTVDMEQA